VLMCKRLRTKFCIRVRVGLTQQGQTLIARDVLTVTSLCATSCLCQLEPNFVFEVLFTIIQQPHKQYNRIPVSQLSVRDTYEREERKSPKSHDSKKLLCQ